MAPYEAIGVANGSVNGVSDVNRVDTNGSSGVNGTTNGHTNGDTNGHANGYTNGHTNGHHHNHANENHHINDTVGDNGEEEGEEEEEEEMFPEDLGLRIMGMGVQYPQYRVQPKDLDTIAQKFYPQTDALKKVLSINRYTGITARPSIGEHLHPLANQPTAPTITDLHSLFLTEGVPLSVLACQQALKESTYKPSQITHTVFTTCTDSSNPGYDTFVLKSLGIKNTVEKVLLSGVGCSGGLAGLRTACNIALGAKARGRKARILVCATEICTVLVRSELDSIVKEDNVRIGITLFSDCSSAVVISNGIGEDVDKKGVYEILGWKHKTLDDTEAELGFDVDPLGWKVILTPKVPTITSFATPSLYNSLLSSIPPSTLSTLSSTSTPSISPTDLDWALHPGGSLILTSIESTMSLTPSQLRASFEVYTNYGNSSSATVFSVMDRLRSDGEAGIGGEGKEYGPGVGIKGGRKGVVGCAFGPGVSVEMVLMRRVEKGDHNTDKGIVEVTNGIGGVSVGGEELD
ncbi:hypothetical protein TWF679_000551 [Orbilia oligospora]|uniref:Type III Polyketide synthases (Type III PKS) n=2 Tax=Orbilia oligospora TaxID=2813651 RepID=A0A8H8UXH3_ORBOL|nr:hypothetical protein TWF679_000551 [Orbilia oligospora]